MQSATYVAPALSVLKQFGFQPMGIQGFFQSNYSAGILSVLVLDGGQVSLYEEPEFHDDEVDLYGESVMVYRLKKIPVDNDTELLFFLKKVFPN
jgi:hypothetical protein